MQKHKTGCIVFSPSDLTRFFESEFPSWMDRYQRFPSADGAVEGFHRNPDDPLDDLLAQKRDSHENEVRRMLGDEGPLCENTARRLG
jgi:hypothetical protein